MENKKFLELLKVINDNTRLTIIQMLSNNGKMCACKILEKLSITQGTLSYHMKVLNYAKLVSCEKNGKWCYYSLRVDTFDKIASFVNDICVSDEKIKRS